MAQMTASDCVLDLLYCMLSEAWEGGGGECHFKLLYKSKFMSKDTLKISTFFFFFKMKHCCTLLLNEALITFKKKKLYFSKIASLLIFSYGLFIRYFC